MLALQGIDVFFPLTCDFLISLILFFHSKYHKQRLALVKCPVSVVLKLYEREPRFNEGSQMDQPC